MKYRLFAVLAALVMVFGLTSVTAPAQAVTYSNCNEYSSTISFDDYYASVYPGTLGWGTAKVVWGNCLASDGSASRNNAKRVVFSVKCDNPNWIEGLHFDLSSIEGLDLGSKFVGCDGTNWTSKSFDLSTPGYTFAKKDWSVKHRRDNTAFASAQFVPETWESHGPAKWGGRANLSMSD